MRPDPKGLDRADYLIASDLPLQGSSRTQAVQINKAIAYLLEQAGWKAGKFNIGFQACDDASAQLAKWVPSKCSANAHAYAADTSVLGVIGTFNSGCAAIEIPITNQAPGGGLQMVSPANTYGCLTEPCAGNEPEKYYPSGKRTYARVAPSDPNQGAVDGSSCSRRASRPSTSSTTRRPTASASPRTSRVAQRRSGCRS